MSISDAFEASVSKRIPSALIYRDKPVTVFVGSAKMASSANTAVGMTSGLTKYPDGPASPSRSASFTTSAVSSSGVRLPPATSRMPPRGASGIPLAAGAAPPRRTERAAANARRPARRSLVGRAAVRLTQPESSGIAREQDLDSPVGERPPACANARRPARRSLVGRAAVRLTQPAGSALFDAATRRRESTKTSRIAPLRCSAACRGLEDCASRRAVWEERERGRAAAAKAQAQFGARFG